MAFGIQTPHTNCRLECMLRALLVARRYDVGSAVVDQFVPMAEHTAFLEMATTRMLARDALGVRKAQRGEAVLAHAEDAMHADAERAAKRQCLETGLGADRVADVGAVERLAAVHGSTRALNHQADLWAVRPGKNKAQTSARIAVAIRASQGAGTEETEVEAAPDDEDEEEEWEETPFV